MQYPFSGMIVRFIEQEIDTKCCSAKCSRCNSSGNKDEESKSYDFSSGKTIEKDIASSDRLEPSGEAALSSDQSNRGANSQAALASNPEVAIKSSAKDIELGKVASTKSQLHVNIWEIDESYFIDIGVMIDDWAKYKYVQVDLPWEVNRSDVSDLGARLNGEKAVAAIFNEVVHYDGLADGNFAVIRFEKPGSEVSNRNISTNGLENAEECNDEGFTLLRLNHQFIQVESIPLAGSNASSRLMIELPRPYRATEDKKISTKAAYIRFRIVKVPRDVYTKIFTQHDSGLFSSTVETRIIDFRINERRGVPDELLSSNRSLNFPLFEKIHCFITVNRQQDCISSSGSYKGFRSLFDETIWNEYIRLDSSESLVRKNSVRDYLGHQWTSSKKDGCVSDLVVLGRFTRNLSSWLRALGFVCLGLIFGAAGNGIWELMSAGSEPGSGSVSSTLLKILGLSFFAFVIVCASTTTFQNFRKKLLDRVLRIIDRAR